MCEWRERARVVLCSLDRLGECPPRPLGDPTNTITPSGMLLVIDALPWREQLPRVTFSHTNVSSGPGSLSCVDTRPNRAQRNSHPGHRWMETNGIDRLFEVDWKLDIDRFSSLRIGYSYILCWIVWGNAFLTDRNKTYFFPPEIWANNQHSLSEGSYLKQRRVHLNLFRPNTWNSAAVITPNTSYERGYGRGRLLEGCYFTNFIFWGPSF